MHLAMAIAEEANVVNPTEGARPPALMNVPRRAASRNNATTAPSTTAGVHRASTLFKAPGCPAATDLCVRVTERPDSVSCTEGSAPSVECSSLQSSLVLPPYLGRCWVRLLLWAWHVLEGAQGIESGRLIREDICRLVCRCILSRVLLSDLIEAPALAMPSCAMPATTPRMHCGTAHAPC